MKTNKTNASFVAILVIATFIAVTIQLAQSAFILLSYLAQFIIDQGGSATPQAPATPTATKTTKYEPTQLENPWTAPTAPAPTAQPKVTKTTQLLLAPAAQPKTTKTTRTPKTPATPKVPKAPKAPKATKTPKVNQDDLAMAINMVERGMTQKKAAEMAGISASTLSRALKAHRA